MHWLHGLGNCIGALLGGILADLFGRRTICLCFAVLWNVSGWGFSIAGELFMIKAWYIIASASASSIYIVSFVNFGEITNKTNRFLSVCTNASYVMGQFLSSHINRALQDWMFLTGFIAVTNTLVIFSTWYIPESPRWLLTKNKRSAAYTQLDDISGLFYDVGNENTDADPVPANMVLFKMVAFLFTKRKKYFCIFVILMFILSSIYNLSQLDSVLCFLPSKTFIKEFTAPIAEALGYFLVILVYIFLGKRHGLLLMFVLLIGYSLIFVIRGPMQDDILLTDIFGVLLSAGAIHLIFFYVMDLFPTFLRATILGIGFAVHGTARILSNYLKTALIFTTLNTSRSLFITFLFATILGFLVLKLPETINKELASPKLN